MSVMPEMLPGEVFVDGLIHAESSLGHAVFSPDRLHRYELERYVEPSDAPVFITIVMVNPSTACAFKNDQTIGGLIMRLRCWRERGITQATAFRVVNLFSLRSSTPDALYEAVPCDRGADARNDEFIINACTRPGMVIAAWGEHGALGDRGRNVVAMLLGRGVTLYALKLTKSGSPSHPHARGKARIPDDVEPFVWRTP